MSEFKGTKGEWIVKDRSSKFESTIYSENKRICDVKSYGNDFESFDNNGNKYSEPSYKERLYNEKLIACAPEMLELLKYLNACGGLGYEKHDRIEQLISKATTL